MSKVLAGVHAKGKLCVDKLLQIGAAATQAVSMYGAKIKFGGILT